MACPETQNTVLKGAHAAEFARFMHVAEKGQEKERRKQADLKEALRLVEKEASQGANGAVPSEAGNDLLQINAGPAALAMPMIFEAMGLYATIINLQQQQRVAMINTQAESAQAQADATEEEGKQAYKWALISGGIMMGAAVASVGALVGMKATLGRDNAADQERINKELQPMQAVQSNFNEKPIVSPAGSPGGVAPSSASQKVQDQMLALENGEYSKATAPEDKMQEWNSQRGSFMKRRLDDIRGKPRLKEADVKEKINTYPRKAVRRLKGKGFTKWKQAFYKRYDAKQQEALSLTNRDNIISQYITVATQTVSGIGQGGSAMANGRGQAEQAKYRAAASLDQVASSMAGGNSQETAQAMSKADDAQKQEVQVLREIDRSNSVQV